jgi:hypothetical protein
MKRAILVLSALFGLCVLSQGPADAQARPTSPKAGRNDDTQYRKLTRYDFDNDQVEGNILQPEDLLVPGRRLTKKESLVRPRANFIPEMIKTTQGL